MDNKDKIIQAKLEKLALLEERERLRFELPHLYRDKEYAWSKKFRESKAKRLVCTAANQIGKSTVHYKRIIDFITDVKRWPERWPKLHSLGLKPTKFLFLMPDSKTMTAEFEDKFMPLLPRGQYKDDPHYGWKKPFYSNGRIESLEFLNGITLEFLTYSQDTANIQARTAAYVAADEELPEHFYPELALRMESQDGYFSIVFTATRGQNFWREITEDRSNWTEQDVEVMQISMYDCQAFLDGTEGLWPADKIKRVESRLRSPAEIQRRVWGRFVVSEGLKYPTFNRSRHLVKGHHLPSDWLYYAGCDYGGGGTDTETTSASHPSSIGILAVSPDYTKARVVRCWRGDGELTTSEDVVKKYVELSTGLPPIITCFYDWGAKDLGTFATRLGLPFQPAEKSHEIGESTLNTLFKMDALKIHDNSGDHEKLCRELESLLNKTNKRVAKDDLIDGALRYPCAKLPWNWEKITSALPVPEKEKTLSPSEQEAMERRTGNHPDPFEIDALTDIESEMSFWNDLH